MTLLIAKCYIQRDTLAAIGSYLAKGANFMAKCTASAKKAAPKKAAKKAAPKKDAPKKKAAPKKKK